MNVTVVSNQYETNDGMRLDIERLNVLSKYVKTKENGKKNVKSSLEAKINSKILDINAANEKPAAILDNEKNDEIPFDLFFCDFIKEIEYGAVILNKKNDKKILKENQKTVKLKTIILENLKDLEKLIRESFFLSEKIRNRYYHIVRLIRSGMKGEGNESKSSLTRTGNVYKISLGENICFDVGTHKISVKIFETEKAIQIESDTPMAIVELIEEVKNEREELREMNDEEFKIKWKKYTIDDESHKNDKELDEKLKKIRNEQEKILKGKLKEIREKYMKIGEEIQSYRNERWEKINEIKRKNNKELKEKLDNIRNEQEKIWEEKEAKIIEHSKFSDRGLLKMKDERKKISILSFTW
ncbi:unnamed protein product [Meloidogyne enterolobii]|uniref:Uncharacterized protein n=1 Tax=Meloidogyne enterolobii TaxID=390850 RepID=A0ACB1AET8_MELEN